MSERKEVRLRFVEQGAVRVNSAHVHRESSDIACIYIDLDSKRVEMPMRGTFKGESPALFFTAGEYALHLDESKPRNSITIVEFPDYAGWQFFSVDEPGRYTLGVVLVANAQAKRGGAVAASDLGAELGGKDKEK